VSAAKEVLEILVKDGVGAGITLFEGPQDPALVVPKARLHEVCAHLRRARHLAFDYCALVTGTHMTEKVDAKGNVVRKDGFEVIYHLRSLPHHRALALKVVLPVDAPALASVADLWRAADWHERETFDMVGIVFEGHPNLKRILLPDDWEGHPLRKDYLYPRSYQGISLEVDPEWPQP
jgi:NADH-quinone oxidoreductase subunit C